VIRAATDVPTHGRFVVVPASYVFLLRDGAAAGGATGGATEVLLQLRQGTGYMDDHWAAAAAGHVEADESVFAAACREAAEEIGVKIEPVDLEPLTTMHRTHGNHDPIDERVDFFFAARSWSGEPRIVEPGKCADLRWFPLDALPDPVVPHERQVLESVRAGGSPPIVTFGF